jgi:ADP-heptose:LPS heptosyltransferase
MKILILHNAALGDFVTFLPFLNLLIYNYPESEIILYTNKKYFPLMQKFNKLNNRNIDDLPLYKLFLNNPDLEQLEFFKYFNEIISFVGAHNVIFKRNMQKLNKNSIFIFPHNKNYQNIHQCFYLINSYPFKQKRFLYADVHLEKREKKFFIIHPGSGSKSKNISLDFFKSLENNIKKKFNITSLWIGGEAEKYLKNKMNILISESINELLDSLSHALFYIGNDSGVSHVAAACNLLTFTFFTHTSPFIWAPLGRKSICFYKNLNCSPCDNPCKNRECANFREKDVLDLLFKLIEQEIIHLSK